MQPTSLNNNMIIINDPGPMDHLLGRGGRSNEHVANKKYRRLIHQHKKQYSELPSAGNFKTEFTMTLVQKWKTMGGRFLKQASPKGWVEVSDAEARKITSQKIREKNAEDFAEEITFSSRPTTPHPQTIITQKALLITPPQTPLRKKRLSQPDLPDALLLPFNNPPPPLTPHQENSSSQQQNVLCETNPCLSNSFELLASPQSQGENCSSLQPFVWPPEKPMWGPWSTPNKPYRCFE